MGAAQPIPLWPSSEPVTSASVPHQPGLVQWLALADQKHCEELVESCVTQLTSSDGDMMRQALTSRSLGPLVDGLSSETKSDIIWRMAGLPLSIKVGMGLSKCMPGLIPFFTDSYLTVSPSGAQDPGCGESATHDVITSSLARTQLYSICLLRWYPILYLSLL
jgi:hypothetical protein